MSTNGSFIAYLAVRTFAFVGLTAVSTMVMALPYLT